MSGDTLSYRPNTGGLQASSQIPMQISITAVDSNSIHIMQGKDLKAKDEDSMFIPPHIMDYRRCGRPESRL